LATKKKREALFGIAVIGICFAINIMIGVESNTTGNDWIDTVLGIFIRVNPNSYFPFVSWSVFPILGYIMAFGYMKVGRKKAVIFAAVFGSALYIFAKIVMHMNEMMDAVVTDAYEIDDKYYYSMHPVYAIGGFGIILIEYALCALVIKMCHDHVKTIFLNMSKGVMFIYIIQWILIGLSSPFLAEIRSLWLCLVIALLILAVSYSIGCYIMRKWGNCPKI